MAQVKNIYVGNSVCSAAYVGDVPIIIGDSGNLENSVVREYIKASQIYSGNDYSYTVVTDYYQVPTTYRKDQPFPTIIRWFTETTYDSFDVIISKSNDYTDPQTLHIADASLNYINVYNLLPLTTYYYKVIGNLGGNETIIKENTITTKGQVRMVKVDSVMNVRDMGGWKIGSNNRVKYGRLFRGGEFDNANEITISQADITTLRDVIGINAEIDFRSSAESYLKTKSALGDDVAFFRRATDNYVKAVSPDNGGAPYLTQNALKKIIEWLADGKNVYLHCQGGADRTGAVSMLIEAILGVSENDCCRDWEITSFSQYGLRQRNSNSYNFKGTVEYLKTYNGGTFQEKVINWAKTNFPNEYDFAPLTDSEIDTLRSIMTG